MPHAPASRTAPCSLRPWAVQDETLEPRYNNLGAVAQLTGPTWAAPRFLQYEADLPRPPARPYYDIDIPGAGPGAAQGHAVQEMCLCSTKPLLLDCML